MENNKIWYLGVCYQSENKQEMMFRKTLASKAASWLMNKGFCVYSPISHGAEIERFLPPKGHEFWMSQCLPILNRCDGFFVLLLPGSRDSKGLKTELSFWRDKRREKPIAIVPLLDGFVFARQVDTYRLLSSTEKSKKEVLDFYMSIPYKIEVEKISDSEGGGYLASYPMFGKLCIVGDGKTEDEAIANLKKVKKERFLYYIENGINIPAPTKKE